jgi:hypothetical protein
MTEHKPGTVPYASKKWSPMLGGLSGRSADICSWVMENEARHLNSNKGASSMGPVLKYIFPVIRKTVEIMASQGPLNAELSRGVVTEVTIESFGVVHQVATGMEPSNELNKFMRNLRDDAMVTDLAGRIHASILSFPA